MHYKSWSVIFVHHFPNPLEGAVVIAVGESMTLLGEKSWYCSNDMVVPFKGGIFSGCPILGETGFEMV